MAEILGTPCDYVEVEVGEKDNGERVVAFSFVIEYDPRHRSAMMGVMPLDQLPNLLVKIENILASEGLQN